jgi:hypothetical protein
VLIARVHEVGGNEVGGVVELKNRLK